MPDLWRESSPAGGAGGWNCPPYPKGREEAGGGVSRGLKDLTVLYFRQFSGQPGAVDTVRLRLGSHSIRVSIKLLPSQLLQVIFIFQVIFIVQEIWTLILAM